MANERKLSEQLRRFVVASGMTRYQIAKLTGLTESTLSRFVVGGMTPRMATADKLAKLLDLELHRKTRRKG